MPRCIGCISTCLHSKGVSGVAVARCAGPGPLCVFAKQHSLQTAENAHTLTLSCPASHNPSSCEAHPVAWLLSAILNAAFRSRIGAQFLLPRPFAAKMVWRGAASASHRRRRNTPRPLQTGASTLSKDPACPPLSSSQSLRPPAKSAADLLAGATKKGKSSNHLVYVGEGGCEAAARWLDLNDKFAETERELALARDRVLDVIRPWHEDACMAQGPRIHRRRGDADRRPACRSSTATPSWDWIGKSISENCWARTSSLTSSGRSASR